MSNAIPEPRDNMTPNPWEKTFPKNLEEVVPSKDFIYRFLVCSSAMILSKRGILPDECFKSRKIERLNIPNYNADSQQGKRLKSKLEGVKDAIEKKYLDEFAIVFYNKPDEEDVFEVFSFRFHYMEDETVGVSLNTGIHTDDMRKNLLNFKFESLNKVKEQFITFMKILHRYVAKCLEDLPENADGSFRVSYKPDTPEDYVPAGFEVSDSFYQMKVAKDGTSLGIIGGGHHCLQLAAASLLQKSSISDFNKTISSMDDSIIVRKNTSKVSKAAPLKMRVDKKTSNARRYGLANPIARTPVEKAV